MAPRFLENLWNPVLVRFNFLTHSKTMKIAVFSDGMPPSLVDVS
jgi:hypothetical protein